ncbi:MAG: hypothetical protein ACRYGP_28785, partial [Janthinobacterium lividum]
MAVSQIARTASARKTLTVVPACDQLPQNLLRAPHRRCARRSRTRHLTVDQYVRLLACIEREGGIATLDEISRALPCVLQPISA